MQNIATLARENLIEAKKKLKQYYDKKIKPVNFKVGDSLVAKRAKAWQT